MTERQPTTIPLKPCPFCGSGALLLNIADTDSDNLGAVYVECRICHASTALVFPSMEDARPRAVELWNRRVCK